MHSATDLVVWLASHLHPRCRPTTMSTARDSPSDGGDAEPDPREPDQQAWDVPAVNPLDVSYFSEHGVVVYDTENDHAWIEADHAIPRKETA